MLPKCRVFTSVSAFDSSMRVFNRGVGYHPDRVIRDGVSRVAVDETSKCPGEVDLQ